MATQQPPQGQPRRQQQPQQQQYGPPYAGLGDRAIALIIDTLLVGFTVGALGAALVDVGQLNIFLAAAGLAYFIGLEGANDGQTIGKQLMDIRVTTETGDPIDFAESGIRNLLRIVDALPFFYIVGIIMVSTNDENKRVGDLVANTIVVDAAPAPQGRAQQQGYQQGGQPRGQQGGQRGGQRGGQQGGQQQDDDW